MSVEKIYFPNISMDEVKSGIHTVGLGVPTLYIKGKPIRYSSNRKPIRVHTLGRHIDTSKDNVEAIFTVKVGQVDGESRILAVGKTEDLTDVVLGNLLRLNRNNIYWVAGAGQVSIYLFYPIDPELANHNETMTLHDIYAALDSPNGVVINHIEDQHLIEILAEIVTSA